MICLRYALKQISKLWSHKLSENDLALMVLRRTNDFPSKIQIESRTIIALVLSYLKKQQNILHCSSNFKTHSWNCCLDEKKHNFHINYQHFLIYTCMGLQSRPTLPHNLALYNLYWSTLCNSCIYHSLRSTLLYVFIYYMCIYTIEHP